MSKSVIKYTVFLFVISFMTLNSNAQNFFSSGLNAGVKGGASLLMAEIPYDFSHKIIEFDNKFGFSIDAELSKYLSSHWEVAISFNLSALNGESQNSSFSAEGHHPAFIEPITEPVEYNNILTGQNIFFRFYLLPLSNSSEKVNMYPFISAGIGYLNYRSKFQYIDPNDGEIIFGKGVDGYTSLSTVNYSLGGGIKTSLTSKLYMITSMNINLVPYDFLDVVHNYDGDGSRLDLIGVFAEFKVGIFYSLTPFTSGEGRNKKSPSQDFLPFGK